MSKNGGEFTPRRYIAVDKSDLCGFFKALAGQNLSAQAMVENLMRDANLPKTDVLVVEEDGQIVGYAQSHQTGMMNVHFDRAAVLRNYRQKGVFKALLNNVIRGAGGAEITAEVSADAHHLEAMKRVGFIEQEQKGNLLIIKRPRRKILGLF